MFRKGNNKNGDLASKVSIYTAGKIDARAKQAVSLLASAFFCVLWWSGCRNAAAVSKPAPLETAVSTAGTLEPTGTSVSVTSDHEPFDSERAFASLKKQCDYGVRPLGSEAHEKLKDYLIAQMKLNADVTTTQEFKYKGLPVTNVIGVFYPEKSSKPSGAPILLMTHWDTRPIADGPYSDQIKKGVQFRYRSGEWKPQAPIMGANDAASGVGVLLELARLFKHDRPPVGVVILLDDGEDYGDFTASNNVGDGVELGARYFAKHYRENKLFGQPVYGILLDMVGARDAFFVKEALSQSSAPNVNDRVFAIAQSLGYGNVFRSVGLQSVGDDHVSINEAGIPTIDIIHPLPFGEYVTTGYTHWHTQQDTPAQCSASTLKAVGDTLAEAIYRETPAP